MGKVAITLKYEHFGINCDQEDGIYDEVSLLKGYMLLR